MHFHGMAVPFTNKSGSSFPFPNQNRNPQISNKKRQYPYGIFIYPAPYWQGVCRARLAKPLHSPQWETLSSPHPSSGVLFRLPSPGRSIIMAPLRASCHRKPRTGCRSLPSFSCYGPSVYPTRGQAGHGEAGCPAQLYQGKTS